jgi:hypothetical protein
LRPRLPLLPALFDRLLAGERCGDEVAGCSKAREDGIDAGVGFTDAAAVLEAARFDVKKECMVRDEEAAAADA